jgi:hypothetical protein
VTRTVLWWHMDVKVNSGEEKGKEVDIQVADQKQSSLARLAYSHYSKEYLWQCTLVSTWEPCAMCSGVSSIISISQSALTLSSNDILGTHRTSNLRCNKRAIGHPHGTRK